MDQSLSQLIQDEEQEDVETMHNDSDFSEEDEYYRQLIQRQEQELIELRRRHQIEQELLRTRRLVRKGEHPPRGPIFVTPPYNRRPQSLPLGQPASPQRSPRGSPSEGDDRAVLLSPHIHPTRMDSIGEKCPKKERIIPEDMLELAQNLGCNRVPIRIVPEKITLNQMKAQQQHIASSVGGPIPTLTHQYSLPSNVILTTSGYSAAIPVLPNCPNLHPGITHEEGQLTRSLSSHLPPCSSHSQSSASRSSTASPQQPTPISREGVGWAKWD